MKRLLSVTLAVLAFASSAVADHIGIYPDATGSSCNLLPGFSTTATVIHKFTIGSTGSRFKVDTSLCPGTSIFAFSSPYSTIGTITIDLSVGYGTCLSGSIPLGTMIATWQPGAVSIVAADLQPYITVTDCAFAFYPATGGHASISGDGHGCDADPVQPSTWGRVKALYR